MVAGLPCFDEFEVGTTSAGSGLKVLDWCGGVLGGSCSPLKFIFIKKSLRFDLSIFTAQYNNINSVITHMPSLCPFDLINFSINFPLNE